MRFEGDAVRLLFIRPAKAKIHRGDGNENEISTWISGCSVCGGWGFLLGSEFWGDGSGQAASARNDLSAQAGARPFTLPIRDSSQGNGVRG